MLDLSARSVEWGLDAEIVGFGPQAIPDNPFPRELIHELPIRFPEKYCYSSELTGWVRDNLQRFDGVILHGMWLYPNWAFAQACVKARIPPVCFPHGMLEPWALYGQGLLKAVKEDAVLEHPGANDLPASVRGILHD